MSSKVPQPPKWADRFLSWFCNPKLLEQIQGDVHELFYWRLEEKGLNKAKRSFAWDVVTLFRWSNIKRSNKNQKLNNMGIVKNYFKIGVRNLWKQRMSSIINVLGLSIALACSIVAFKWIEYSYVKDKTHENSDDIFLVTHWEELESNKGRNGATDNKLTKEILASVPGIKSSTRYAFYKTRTMVGDKEFGDFSMFVDEDYLDIFTFQLVAGNMNALYQPDKVVINEEVATQYFGQEYGIDQQIELKIGDEWKVFTVGAVLKNGPRNSSLRNFLLINYSHYEQFLSKTRDTWNTNFFIQRQEGIEEAQLLAAMDELLPVHNKDNEINPYTNFELEPLRTMALNSWEISNGVGSGPQLAPNLFVGSIAIFMLLLATFNFINISLAMVMKRLKEIGIRKVIGGHPWQLVLQFLTENFIVCTFSLLLGLLLSSAFLLPGFNEISGSNLTTSLLQHQNFWWFLVAILLFITLASGIYPAVVASAYKPTSILRKSVSTKGNSSLSSFLLTFQMILAMITIVAAVMFVHTNKVNETRDWGYDQYNKLTITIPDSVYREPFRAYLEANPVVLKVAGTEAQIGRELNGYQFKNGEVANYAEFFDVGASYPDLLELELVKGRLFDPELNSDLEQTLVVNEAFLEQLELTFNEDGTQILQDTTEYTIIGVVEDFFYWMPDQKIRGMALRAVPEQNYRAFTVEMADGNIIDQQGALLKALQEIAPDEQFNISIQEQVFDGHFEEMNGIRNIMLFTATIAILIASMGLYGLLNINVSSQLKMFGIRKVLGANAFELGLTILKRFRFVLLFAVLIGSSLAVLLIGELLGSVYAYYPSVGAAPLLVSALILLGVALITINFQVQKVKKLNPAETLRID